MRAVRVMAVVLDLGSGELFDAAGQVPSAGLIGQVVDGACEPRGVSGVGQGWRRGVNWSKASCHNKQVNMLCADRVVTSATSTVFSKPPNTSLPILSPWKLTGAVV